MYGQNAHISPMMREVLGRRKYHCDELQLITMVFPLMWDTFPHWCGLHGFGLHAVILIWVCTLIMNAGGSTKQSGGCQRIYMKQVNTLLLEEWINLLVLPLEVNNAAWSLWCMSYCTTFLYYIYVLYTVCSDEEIKRLLKAHPNIMNHWTKRSKKLNDIQKEALCCAFKNRFQLIQGPPG